MSLLQIPSGVTLETVLRDGDEVVVTSDALTFLADLHRTFEATRRELLARRIHCQRERDAGRETFDFLSETAHVRTGEWTCAPIPDELRDRRVEITGPVDRKMVINALNSGARVYMADFEDSTTPTWRNLLDGQINLRDAVSKTISLQTAGKSYSLAPKVATLFVRPRGWHLTEAHVRVDGERMSGSLFDFGLFVFHNAKEQLSRNTAPYFYLPKLESHLEARLWNGVFLHTERTLGLPLGTIKATVLIETLPAAFEMNEILWELREHSAGLNCGRWDYIFSTIKKRANDPASVMPDRVQITMDKGFLRAYSELLIKTCHRRGVHAMGGMAAQIPIKDDAAKNDSALAKVRADKEREAKAGHDGTWVAHPGLVPVAMEVFNSLMPGDNQIANLRSDVRVSADDLLAIPEGSRTEDGLRHNIKVGVQYLEAWLRGQGCVPLAHLMEDAATAEISRAQIWQWLHNSTVVGGAPLTRERYLRVSEQEIAALGADRFAAARALFDQMCVAPEFADFLTVPAYEQVLNMETSR